MRVSERGVLASLALILLAFSAVAETKILEGRGSTSPALSWQSEIGFYLPFVLFALVSTYHFLEWARKHKRQAIALMLLMFGVASLIGTAAVNAPRPTLNTPTQQQIGPTQQQSQASVVQVPQPPGSLQEDLIKLREALNSTPYFSASFNALVFLASLLAIVLIVVKLRRGGEGYAVKPSMPPRVTGIVANTPREVVIQSYRLACASLQSGGLTIPDSDTPSDVCVRTKEVKPMLGDSLWKLTLLFEEAKFSLHSISETQAEEACRYSTSISLGSSSAVQK